MLIYQSINGTNFVVIAVLSLLIIFIYCIPSVENESGQ